MPSPAKSKKSPARSASSAVPRGRSQDWLWGAALVALAALVYLPSLKNGFIWDDDMYVVNNLTLRDSRGLAAIWFQLNATPQYYPLVHTTFWVEYHLWARTPPATTS